MHTLATSHPATEADRSVVDPPNLVEAFVDLLAKHPDTLVAAIGDDGIITKMPDDVPLLRHRVAVGRSVIDMVVGSDKVGVISAWERSRQTGGANTLVHLLTDPDQGVILTLVDAMREYGVHLAVFVAASGPNGKIGQDSLTAIAPRTARVVKTELAVITAIDAATTQILGWLPEEIVGRRSLDFIHPDDQERSISNWMEMLTAPGRDQRVRLRHLAADGSWVWMEITNHNLLNSSNDPCVVAEMLDISEELTAQEALRASEQLLRRLAESLPLGVVQIEADRRISYANPRLAAITGSTSTDTIADQFRHVVATDRPSFDAALKAVLDGGLDQDLPVDFRGSSSVRRGSRDEIRHTTMSMRSLTNANGVITGAIVCVSDVSEQVRMTAELEQRATIDALTGCLNRLSIMSRLEHCLLGLRDRGDDDGVAIVFVDLNDFKAVNDDLGHAAGDALLCGVGELLRQAVREVDIVGRVGGDEFLVVCPNVATLDAAQALAGRIDRALEAGVSVGDMTLVVTASLGVAHTNDATTSSDRLVADADTKMYIDKRHRKDRAGIAEDTPPRGHARRDESSAALREAIAAHHLEVHYQPIVDLFAGELFGLEALVRWRRDGAIVPAVEFIGLAERSGLITDIGTFVLGDSMATAGAVAAGLGEARWFLNMSPLELSAPGKVADVRAALRRNQVEPARLVIEITEHNDLARSTDAVRAVCELADSGIAIALDDFGTGFGSLALLRSVPVSFLKFDHSFTVDLGHDPVAGHLLETCIDLTDRLGMTLVAEGVETVVQREHLITTGVRLAQGYLFAEPQPISTIVACSQGDFAGRVG